MMRVAVIGAQGQLGAAVVHELLTVHEVKALGRADLDITSDADVGATIDRLRPDAIVNCAAYNDVDGAEDHPIEALNVNTFGVRSIAHTAAAVNAAWAGMWPSVAQARVGPQLKIASTAETEWALVQ